MSIKVNSSFLVQAPAPIDTRLTLTKAQMLTTNDNLMPSVYFALCIDDNAFYLYSKANTVDEHTGKFRYMFDQGGPAGGGVSEERVLELISENAASKEDMETAQEQLAAILADAPADCDTFKEVSEKFELTPNTAITSEEISDIITGG